MELDFTQSLLEKPSVMPQTNMKFRLQMRDAVLMKAEEEPEYPFAVFMNYEFLYDDVLQVISTVQYLKMCRRCDTWTDERIRAFVCYSLLSMCLDGPVTHGEYTSCSQFLVSKMDVIPSYLVGSVEELLALTEGIEQGVCEDEPTVMEHNLADMIAPTSTVDFDVLFGASAPGNSERRACVELRTALLSGASGDVCCGYFGAATHECSDIGLVWESFRHDREVYSNFCSFVVAIARVCDRDGVYLNMLRREFRVPQVRDHMTEVIDQVAGMYLSTTASIPLDTVNALLDAVLVIAADFSANIDIHILAALQLRERDSCVNFCRALTLWYSEHDGISPLLATIGFELLSEHMVPYAACMFQWIEDASVLALFQDISLTTDQVLMIEKYFWDLQLLGDICRRVKDKDLVRAVSAVNAEQKWKNPHFQNVCTMRMLNDLNSDLEIVQGPIFMICRDP